MEQAGQRKADQGRGRRAAEDDDAGMDVQEHAQVAAHQDQGAEDDETEGEPKAGGQIHKTLQRNKRHTASRVATIALPA